MTELPRPQHLARLLPLEFYHNASGNCETSWPRIALCPSTSTPTPQISLPSPSSPCPALPQVAKEELSVKAELAVLVRDEGVQRDLYRMGEDDIVELGPFQVSGLCFVC